MVTTTIAVTPGEEKMKTKTMRGIFSSILIAAVLSIQLPAQNRVEPIGTQTRYVVRALRTLGGTQGGANSITDSGSVMGWSNLPGDQAEHGVLWRGLTMTDLGTLGGPNSASTRNGRKDALENNVNENVKQKTLSEDAFS